MDAISVKVEIPPGLNTTSARVLRAINKSMNGVGVRAYRFWQSLANDELETSYQKYIGSMSMTSTAGVLGVSEINIGIHGFLPMAVEFGAPKFDMKQRLHGGKATQLDMFDSPRAPVRINKAGMRYVVVPMRHATEGSAGNRRMHVPPPAFTKLMKGKKVGYVISGTTQPYTRSQATGYKSAVPRYERLTKMEAKTDTATGKSLSGGWHTFRVMTEDPKQANAWIHPGFQAHMLHERVLEHIDNVLVPELFGPLLALVTI